MIYLLNSGPGRFGNRLFDIHFLYQLKEKYNAEIYIGGLNKELSFFNFKGLSKFKLSIPGILNGDNYRTFEISKNSNFIIKPSFLGEYFHDIKIDINNYIDFKEEFKNSRLNELNHNVAVHFRGTDFHQWNSKSILDSKYYIDSIKEVLKFSSKSVFILYTDDDKLDSYANVVMFLNDNDMPYILGRKSEHFMLDFYEMSRCDIIISSPSTFCIWAGILGKPNKKIIHSKEWLNYRIENNDEFWVRLVNDNSLTYNLYKAI